ncbi:hypothetical protein B2G67_06200 [Microbacterium foliorum]|nr:hypothetical protein B2G67_06200 [Microbacterium foliorum]
MHPRPGVVALAFVLVAAGETGGLAGHHQGADGRPPSLECHGEMRGVVAKVAGEVQGGCCAFDEHDSDVGGVLPRPGGDPLVEKCFAHAVVAARVGDVDALHPCGPRRRGVVDEQRFES